MKKTFFGITLRRDFRDDIPRNFPDTVRTGARGKNVKTEPREERENGTEGRA